MTQSDTAGASAGDVADSHHRPRGLKDLSLLTLGALGVVYGDVGASRIYALREALP